MYSTVESVRKESGDPEPEDVTNEEIIDKILMADAIITNSTQTVWDDTMASWQLVEGISELLASSFIMDKYDDPKGEAEKNFDKGMMLLQLLVTEDESAADVIVASPDYKTWPLNPYATTSRGRLGSNPISNKDVGPDDYLEESF